MSRKIQIIFIEYNTNIHVENRNKLGILLSGGQTADKEL